MHTDLDIGEPRNRHGSRVQASVAKRLEELSREADFADKAEVAYAFDVSLRTVERWSRMRVIPQPKKIGRQRLWHLPTLRAALAKEAA